MQKTVDVALVTEGSLILLIQRGWDPYKGFWALPGGYVDPEDTSDLSAALRELGEETNVLLSSAQMREAGTYGTPGRDPRGLFVTKVFTAVIPGPVIAKAASDAVNVRWFPLAGLPEMAFDHAQIISDVAKEMEVKP